MKHVLLTIGLIALCCGCSEKARPPRSDDGRPIKMMVVGQQEDGWERQYPGTVAAAQEVKLGFEVPGQVTELAVTNGKRVEAGALIAKVDPTNYQATLDAAQAQQQVAKVDVERQRHLVQNGAATQQELDEAERRLTAANSDLETARKAVADTQLRAPFAGVVARTLVENHANVRAKQSIVTLQDPSWLEIVVNVPEIDAVLAVPDLSLEERNRRCKPRVTVSTLPDRSFDAQITEFATTADPDTRTYEATLVFQGPKDVSVLPGMTARVTITPTGVQDNSAGIRIPSQCVAGDDSKQPYVWIVDAQGKVSRRPIEVGELSGSLIQVRNGLATGERIALSGVHHLREGLTVREWKAN